MKPFITRTAMWKRISCHICPLSMHLKLIQLAQMWFTTKVAANWLKECTTSCLLQGANCYIIVNSIKYQSNYGIYSYNLEWYHITVLRIGYPTMLTYIRQWVTISSQLLIVSYGGITCQVIANNITLNHQWAIFTVENILWGLCSIL